MSERRSSVIPEGPATLQTKLDGVPFTIFTYRPSRPAAGIVFLFHGRSRTARDYRDLAQEFADATDFIVTAPQFEEALFPVNAYQRGNITNGRGAVRPDTDWSTRFVPLLIRWASGAEDVLPVWLWGFSAGGQFLSRVAAFQDAVTPQRIVIASPSSYVLPVLGRWPEGEAAPYGLGGVFRGTEERERQRSYLARPVTFYVGAEDSEPDDRSMARSPAAWRQGEDRVARACNTFNLGAEIARREGWDFGWRLIIEPGIGHSAADLLSPNRLAYMLHLDRQPDR